MGTHSNINYEDKIEEEESQRNINIKTAKKNMNLNKYKSSDISRKIYLTKNILNHTLQKNMGSSRKFLKNKGFEDSFELIGDSKEDEVANGVNNYRPRSIILFEKLS